MVHVILHLKSLFIIYKVQEKTEDTETFISSLFPHLADLVSVSILSNLPKEDYNAQYYT